MWRISLPNLSSSDMLGAGYLLMNDDMTWQQPMGQPQGPSHELPPAVETTKGSIQPVPVKPDKDSGSDMTWQQPTNQPKR